MYENVTPINDLARQMLEKEIPPAQAEPIYSSIEAVEARYHAAMTAMSGLVRYWHHPNRLVRERAAQAISEIIEVTQQKPPSA